MPSGYIVNISKIRAFRDKTLYLDGGVQAPVSRSFADASARRALKAAVLRRKRISDMGIGNRLLGDPVRFPFEQRIFPFRHAAGHRTHGVRHGDGCVLRRHHLGGYGVSGLLGFVLSVLEVQAEALRPRPFAQPRCFCSRSSPIHGCTAAASTVPFRCTRYCLWPSSP